MIIPVPADHPFAGILVKLQRAEENIANLRNEIFRFFQECEYPVIPHPNDKRWQEAIDYHRNLLIPKRFSVLAGEIVHHWRSCLDHIAWYFSSADYRLLKENAIQFPVIDIQPDADELRRFERQIKGIANPSKVRDLICEMQPYKLGSDALDSPISIVHNMDRFDKHRELTVVYSQGNLILPPDVSPEILAAATAYRNKETRSDSDMLALLGTLDNQGKILPQVAFSNFGNRKGQPVCPSLQILGGAMENVIMGFMGLL
jgi:hypothetical protein